MMTFEENLKRLDEIADSLGGEGVSVDSSIELFKEGVACFEQALKTLSEGQGKVTVLKSRLEQLMDGKSGND